MLTGKSADRLRLNPRKAWYRNLDEVATDGDYAATFVLKRSQPAFLMLLASGMSPVYPCHVNSRDMRTRPIGTGPFKFVKSIDQGTFHRDQGIPLSSAIWPFAWVTDPKSRQSR